MTLAPFVETTRGDTRENLHHGAIAVVDTAGRVLAAAGDPHFMTFTRSTLKALQALPFVGADGPARMGFAQEQVAMLCASHSGEPMHVRNVDVMLERAGLPVKALQCGCHLPYYVDQGVGPAPEHYDERHHNCSGKHAGFLAYCVQHGQPTDSYLDVGHPLQQAIRRDVARAAGLREQDLRLGIDGCSAPTSRCRCRPSHARTHAWPPASAMASSAPVSARWGRRWSPIPTWCPARGAMTRH